MIKILIVDDEKPICDLIDLNLSAAGYFCKSVQDGMKAIECIESLLCGRHRVGGLGTE
jgi:DNA-binding response OmpR family regulator